MLDCLFFHTIPKTVSVVGVETVMRHSVSLRQRGSEIQRCWRELQARGWGLNVPDFRVADGWISKSKCDATGFW